MISKRRRSPRHSVASSLSKLLSSRYIFFGGKGGVGKTTAATATALLLLQHAKPKDSILLFSTDPAHSLSDSLEKKVGNRLVEVAKLRGAKLFAFEMDARAALEEFRVRHGKVLAEIAERGTLLDESDINELLNLSLPGLDEVMALFELSELDRAASYSHIVIDTAPSGHTTRLLRLPEVFARMVTALDRMADKHRYIVAHFARRRVVADEVDKFLIDLNERIQRVRTLLYDPKQTMFALVSIPESMSVSETERYLQVLTSEGIPVTDLIVNRVAEEHDKCSFCHARVVSQRPWLKALSKSFPDLDKHLVPLFAGEIRGLDSLEMIGKVIWTEIKAPISNGSHRRANSEIVIEKTRSFELGTQRITLFGGKGGVGKTTAAAAYALAVAKHNPKTKVLLFSTDPAHSLSDSLEETIGPLKKRIAGVANLDAMEIDSGEWFEDLKKRYRSWTDDLFDSISAGSKLEIKFDREAMRELVELTPPGIDEIAALGAITELVDEDRYQSIVIDTAPTGHVIRFLELPQIVLSWVRTFMKLLLKYQHVVHASRIAEELVSLSKNLKRVQALLTDSKQSEFVGVAIPEQMSLEETADLVAALKHLDVPMQRLLINGVIPESAAKNCNFCRAKLGAQRETLARFGKRLGDQLVLFVADQRNGEIRGASLLLKHFDSWRSLATTNKKNTGSKLRKEVLAVKNGTQPKQANERKRTKKATTK